MIHEIKHRYTKAVLFSLECLSLRGCVEAAVAVRINLTGAYLTSAYLADAYLAGANLARTNLAGTNLAGTNLARANLAGANLARANLAGANLAGANLARANLAGANLAGAYLIDGGQDKRGFRFWCWRNADGVIIYRAGCHEWRDYAVALAHYGDGYTSDGDRAECLARLALMHEIANKRRPA